MRKSNSHNRRPLAYIAPDVPGRRDAKDAWARSTRAHDRETWSALGVDSENIGHALEADTAARIGAGILQNLSVYLRLPPHVRGYRPNFRRDLSGTVAILASNACRACTA